MKCSDSLVTAFDLRLEELPKASNGKFKLFRDQVVRRNPGLVTGIVLHQTAIEFGATAQAVLKADGNRRLAIARRAKGIACHACSFLPETSCERGNKYLDRSALIATVERTNLAFFG